MSKTTCDFKLENVARYIEVVLSPAYSEENTKIDGDKTNKDFEQTLKDLCAVIREMKSE